MMAFIMRCWKKWLNLFFTLALGFVCSYAHTEGITPQRLEAEWSMGQGVLSINSRFKIELPRLLYDALHQGIPLAFRLEFNLTKPKSYAYYKKLRLWFNPTANRLYRLSYHPFTQHYRVKYGELFSDHNSLHEALAQIGLSRSWPVIDSSYLSDLSADKLGGRVQLRLDLADLPDPFQMDTLGSVEWQLSSSWHSIQATAKKDPS